VAGAACLWAGGELIHNEAIALAKAAVGAAPEDGAPTEPPVATGPHLPPATTTAVAPAPEIAPKARPHAGRERTRQAVPKTVCPWCSAEIPTQTPTCPECHASLGESNVAALGIPGVTEVQPSLLKYLEESRTGKRRGGILRAVLSSSTPSAPASTVLPSDASALRPPSAAIRAEMARLDAEIAQGQPEPPEPPKPAEPPAPPAP
jgi:cytochrome c553